MSDVVISGYYGFRNNGDDALLMSIINDLKSEKPDIEIVVLSKNPAETERIYNVRAVNRQDLFGVVKEIKRTRMLISGGGTLIQDGTSTKSLMYYLSIISVALMLGKKVMLYANGIGPLSSKLNRRITAGVLNKVNIITLRDEVSFSELKEIGVHKPNIEITADPAFNLKYDGSTKNRKGKMLVSVRPWKKLKGDFCEVLAKVCDYASTQYGLEIVFLPMQRRVDEEITGRIRDIMSAKSDVMDADYDINKLLTVFEDMDLCLGMRLHTLIYSAVTCTPLVGLVYDPKVNGFLDYIGIGNQVDVETITYEQLKTAVDKSMSDTEKQYSELLKKREELKGKADRNVQLAIELLDGGEHR
ncbi:MAG: polysaccharide pyruvyl transferase CsaB [Eubacteriales bacterium]|nr:polysaccharide pyruvyl transferase CsaB [Eubacteriales bacterium]